MGTRLDIVSETEVRTKSQFSGRTSHSTRSSLPTQGVLYIGRDELWVERWRWIYYYIVILTFGAIKFP